MQITKDQAIALLDSLFAVRLVGVDADGNEYGDERNAHFLDSLRVLFPHIPFGFQLTERIVIPEGVKLPDYRHDKACKQKERRKLFGDILREIADKLEEE